ncbi:MAG: tetrapyrrole methylase family protein / MazG family protein [Thermosediminibacterales bacterium]|nr:tetrapyrrole methylase family protein / MazG family protein [Thermosediminibacterales bacterium]MDK2836754.1 tetrapyrrole methylase family protein / MazG family protein [Thermosediminibacterales bacterium]
MKNIITVIGLGPGNENTLTLGALEAMKNADKVFLRTERHPIAKKLPDYGINYISFDWVYDRNQRFEQVYEDIVKHLMKEALKYSRIVYAVPGNPMVAESSVEILVKKAEQNNIDVKIMPAVSFLDSVFVSLNINPINGIKLIDALQMDMPDTKCGNIVTQIYSPLVASQVKINLMEFYPDEFEVVLIKAAGTPDEIVKKIPLYELDRQPWIDHLTTLYIPPLSLKNKDRFEMKDLVEIMAVLRGENGCPWDLEQDHTSLKQFLLEETYEVLEKIDEKDWKGLAEELGDLLLQIVFHAQIAKENEEFDIYDVITSVSKKMIRRHPHIFGGKNIKTSELVLKNWEEIKKREKDINTYTDTLKDIPKTLPALMRAFKIQQKAALVGFDWDRVEDAFEKVFEEIEELKQVYNSANRDKIKEELGDTLFAVVNVARFLGVNPELALDLTNRKFIKRFSYIEETAKKLNKDLKDMTLNEMDKLWNEGKHMLNVKKNNKKCYK